VRAPLPLIIYPYHSRRLSLVRWAAAPHEHMGENGSQTGWIPAFEDYGAHGGAGTGAEGVSTVHLAHLHPVRTQAPPRLWPPLAIRTPLLESLRGYAYLAGDNAASSRVSPLLHSSGSKRGCRSVLEGGVFHLLISPEIGELLDFMSGACSSHRTPIDRPRDILAGTHRDPFLDPNSRYRENCNLCKHLPSSNEPLRDGVSQKSQISMLRTPGLATLSRSWQSVSRIHALFHVLQS
jgi:hypothetical protein